MIGVHLAAAAAPTLPVARDVAPAPAGTGSEGFAAVLQRAAGTRNATAGPAVTPPGLAGRTVLDTALLSLGRIAGPGGATGDAPAGFIAAVFGCVGVTMPDAAVQQATMGVAVALADARSGDLVVMGDPPHVGIYAGKGRMVHAPADGGPVRLEEIPRSATTVRRVVSEAATAPTAPPPVTGLVPVALIGPGGTPATAATAGGGLAGVPYAELFQRAGGKHGVDPALLAAVARTESGFDPRATSPAGAQGLMQFMPGTAAGLGVDPWDPASAIDGAARYLRQGLDRFGSTELALAAYNAGPGAVQRHRGVPPYAETQNYVRKVLDRLEQYRR